MPSSHQNSSKPPVVRPKLRDCPRCGRKNQVGAVQCWLCLSWLETGLQPMAPAMPASGPSVLKILGIVFGTIGILIVTLIAAAIALFAVCVAALSQ